MRIFARIEDGVVKELHATETDLAGKFPAALRFVEVTGQQVGERFLETAEGFVAPPEPPPAPPPPSLAELQAALARLTAQIAAHAPQG